MGWELSINLIEVLLLEMLHYSPHVAVLWHQVAVHLPFAVIRKIVVDDNGIIGNELFFVEEQAFKLDLVLVNEEVLEGLPFLFNIAQRV